MFKNWNIPKSCRCIGYGGVGCPSQQIVCSITNFAVQSLDYTSFSLQELLAQSYQPDSKKTVSVASIVEVHNNVLKNLCDLSKHQAEL